MKSEVKPAKRFRYNHKILFPSIKKQCDYCQEEKLIKGFRDSFPRLWYCKPCFARAIDDSLYKWWIINHNKGGQIKNKKTTKWKNNKI